MKDKGEAYFKALWKIVKPAADHPIHGAAVLRGILKALEAKVERQFEKTVAGQQLPWPKAHLKATEIPISFGIQTQFELNTK